MSSAGMQLNRSGEKRLVAADSPAGRAPGLQFPRVNVLMQIVLAATHTRGLLTVHPPPLPAALNIVQSSVICALLPLPDPPACSMLLAERCSSSTLFIQHMPSVPLTKPTGITHLRPGPACPNKRAHTNAREAAAMKHAHLFRYRCAYVISMHLPSLQAQVRILRGPWQCELTAAESVRAALCCTAPLLSNLVYAPLSMSVCPCIIG